MQVGGQAQRPPQQATDSKGTARCLKMPHGRRPGDEADTKTSRSVLPEASGLPGSTVAEEPRKHRAALATDIPAEGPAQTHLRMEPGQENP